MTHTVALWQAILSLRMLDTLGTLASIFALFGLAVGACLGVVWLFSR